MRAITPKCKTIDDDNILQVLDEAGWKCRNIEVKGLDSIQPESRREQLAQRLGAHVAEHVEEVEVFINCIFSTNSAALKPFFSGIGSPRATRLKKIHVRGYGGGGGRFLSPLRNCPSLEELKLQKIGFSSVVAADFEEFLANTTTLKKLELSEVAVLDADQEAAVAGSFRRALMRNESLKSIHVSKDPLRESDDTFFREILLGIIKENTSIRKLCLQFLTSYHAEVFRGLSTNSTIEEVVIDGLACRGRGDDVTADAIKMCCANNKTLQKLSCDLGQGPQARKALFKGIPCMTSLECVSLKFRSFDSPEWNLLARALQSLEENRLQVLDLSGTQVSTQTLQTILPCLHRIVDLSLARNFLTFDLVPMLCQFIREAHRLKKLELGVNEMGAEGAARIFETVSGSASLEYLGMEDVWGRDEDGNSIPIGFNGCHASLQILLVQGRLESLCLSGHVPLDGNTIRSISAGLRESKTQTLKNIRLPPLNLAFIDILGEALVDGGCSLVSLVVSSNDTFAELIPEEEVEELSPEEEEAILAFIRLMPRMKTLVSVEGLFDFKPSEIITRALVAALKENTILEQIFPHNYLYDMEHVCNNETVQFYLELNRLGRHHHQAAPEDMPIPAGVLPHLFARMTDPEYASHLHYFLRRTPAEMMQPPNGGEAAV